ncbi:hypothetical protein CW304_01220 [Bacillus sp. UFRGS-B20]|nr:hypothetical protein CW304_01220 [Bacillus sp. UFRGS-B20]
MKGKAENCFVSLTFLIRLLCLKIKEIMLYGVAFVYRTICWHFGLSSKLSSICVASCCAFEKLTLEIVRILKSFPLIFRRCQETPINI